MLALRFATTIGVLFLFGVSLLHAAPGPDGSAEEQSYGVLIYQSGGQQYAGEFIFLGDPERPQRFEIGALQMLLTDPNDEANPGAVGAGTWISLDFFFLDFWLSLANTEGGGNVFALGIAFDDEIFGKAFLLSDANLVSGRYKITGQVGGLDLPADDDMGDDTSPDDNNSPELTSIADQTATVGNELTVNVVAADLDLDDTLTISLDIDNSPAGAVLTDNGDGTASIAWTPDTTGDFSFTVNVTDGTDFDSDTFNVNVAAAP